MADYNEPYQTIKMSGINYDTPAYDLPVDVWTEGKNVRFTNGATVKFDGDAQVFGTLSHAPNWMHAVGYNELYYWVYASDTVITVTDGTTHTAITPTTTPNGNLNDNWNGCIINNLLVMNNATQPPIWWTLSTSTAMTALTAWPTNQLAKVVRSYKNYLVAMNISDASGDYPDLVQWSDAAPPGAIPSSWNVADPTKDAGQTELSDTPGEVVDGLQLGDAFIIYKRRSCYLMQYVGGQYIHNFRKLFDTVGVIAPNCIAAIDNMHLVMTNDDIITHDTVSIKSILDDRMRSWLFNVISDDYYHRSFMVTHRSKREIWICVPTGENEYADTAVVWNYEDDTIGVRDLPLPRWIAAGVVDPQPSTTWDADSDEWDSSSEIWNNRGYSPTADALLIGDRVNSKLLEADTTNQFNGVDIESYVARDSMVIIDRHNIKLLKEVYPRFTSSSNATVKIRIGSQMEATDPVTWGTEQDFVIGTDDKVDTLTKGRYFSIRVYSNTDINWQLHSFDFNIELAERR